METPIFDLAHRQSLLASPVLSHHRREAPLFRRIRVSRFSCPEDKMPRGNRDAVEA